VKLRIASLLSIALVSSAFADGIPKGAVVRIEGSGIEAGWHQGKITVTSEGCTMVTLDRATKDGYTMLALIAITRLEKQQGGAWVDEPVKGLRAKEPKACLEEGSD
jgi:hypothetical protein